MKEGDSNSRYFHGCMKDRVNTNKITSLELDDGTKIFKPTDIHTAAVDHFQKLFSIDLPGVPTRNLSSYVDKFLPPAQAADIIRRVTDEEIKVVLFKMKPDKAPRPDRYSAGFFQKMWHIVGVDVCAAVKSFFDSGRFFFFAN